MTSTDDTRRRLVSMGLLGTVGAALAPLAGCSDTDAKEVGAVEDLMREHGILRRILLVYAESSAKLRTDSASLDATALNKAARLFHDFGEEYHERKLEEGYIFPKVRQGPAAGDVDILLAQHRRGREITQFILGTTAGARIATSDAEPLSRAFES